MITVYKHIEEELVSDCTVSDATKGSWVNLVNPDPDELSLINILTEIPTDVLKTALDMEERSHVELEDNYIFVVINIPAIRGNDMYDTVPLGIFLTPDFFITVCLEESEVLYPFISNQLSTFYTYKKTRFLFQILYRTATMFLRYLQQINRRTDDIEVQLRHTTKNKDFFQLLELQKSMTYFTSALRTNGTVMERLLRLRGHSTYRHLLKMYEEDEDLLEDVIIENKQAIEMVEMYSNILMNMMNTMRRGLATTAMSLVCLMAGTMNTLAATDAGTELVSQIDAAAGEETNGISTEAAQTPSGPASDPELIRKQTNAAAEEAADTNASEAEVAAFSNESAQVEAENADEAAMTENTDTNAAAEAQEAEAPAEIYAGRFTTTAYCSCRRCCRGGKNRTKSGTIPQAGHTISADLRVFPLGTKLRINGVVYTVEDSGSGIRGNKLDIFFNSHSQALQYGKRSADVYIVR